MQVKWKQKNKKWSKLRPWKKKPWQGSDIKGKKFTSCQTCLTFQMPPYFVESGIAYIRSQGLYPNLNIPNPFLTWHEWPGRSTKGLGAGSLQVCLHKMAQTKISLTRRVPKSHRWCHQRAALMKLLFFAATLAILPISSYFFTEKYIWSGTSTTGCNYEFLLIVSSRKFQLCCDHRHMCGQHSPRCVYRRFCGGRQAVVQGSGGEETVRNQEGAINWVITGYVCHCLGISMHAFFLFVFALCRKFQSDRSPRRRLQLVRRYTDH
jgi:hypothetical protein